jgi:putative spermidine/putrescine transport system substrate-binding protein
MIDPVQAYAHDAVEIAQQRVRRGELDRRTFLGALAAIGLAPAAIESAAAESGELVVVNFGGVAAKVYLSAYGPGCKRNTGLKMVVDGSAASPAKIRAMVDAGNVVWDVCDYAPPIGFQLGGKYLEEVDYAIVDKQKLLPGFAFQYGCAAYVFSFIIAYNKQMVPEAPKSWADFWDLRKFPGKRTMYKQPLGQVEAALLAAGVERDKLYPLNLDLALGKIKDIKSEVIWWDTGAQSQQLLRDREVAMGNIWHSRATIMRNESDGKIDFGFNDGIFVVGGWAIPKGNPAGRTNANKFIAAAQDPEAQLKVYLGLFNGPANPQTSEIFPEDKRTLNPSDPGNIKLQAICNPQYWGENGDVIQDRWLDAIS